MELLLALFLIGMVVYTLVKSYIADYKRIHTPEAKAYHKKRMEESRRTGKDIWL